MYLNFCGSYLIGVSRAAETSMLLLIQVRLNQRLILISHCKCTVI